MAWVRSKIVDCSQMVHSMQNSLLILEAGHQASKRGLYWKHLFQEAGLQAEISFAAPPESSEQLKSAIDTSKDWIVLLVPYNEDIGEAMYTEEILYKLRKDFPLIALWADLANSYTKAAYYGELWELDGIFTEAGTSFWAICEGKLPGTMPEAENWQPEISCWQKHHEWAKATRKILVESRCTRLNTVSNDVCECWKIPHTDDFIQTLRERASKIVLMANGSWVIHY